jgi:hypothetical protein
LNRWFHEASHGDPAELAAGHGAALALDLSGVTNALLTATGPGAGRWTFGNRQSVTFTGVKREEVA